MKRVLGVVLALSLSACAEEGRFVLAAPGQQAVVCVSPDEPECVRLAVQDLIRDVEKITGKRLECVGRVPEGKPALSVGTAGISMGKTEAAEGWERFRIEKVSGQSLLICGSDARGTMFGVYDFLEKQLGVDPFYFWKDREPEKRPEISFGSLSVLSKEPSFKYRGWFINDEDLLTGWKRGGGTRRIDYPFYTDVVHPDVMAHVIEALLRNKFNLIIPASFVDITNPPEENLLEQAARRGVFLSQHHVEPLGASAFGYFNYWKKKDGTKPLFSFYSNREKLTEVWEHYAQRWAKYPNVIWQLGLRGIADRPMWQADPGVPQSDAERGRIISEAIAVQRDIIRKYDPRENPPMTATLWAEGSALFHRGYLKLPDDVTVIFSDNSPGWKFQDDFYSIERKKEKQYGVYYHHQLWSSGPHLVQGVSPFWTWTVLKETMAFRASDYAMLNVSNVREFVLGLAASGRHLFDFETFSPERFMAEWARANFPSRPDEARALYDAYFSAFALHPEQKVPVLLDGQTKHCGLAVLDKIRLYAKDKAKFLDERPPPDNTAGLHLPTPHPTEALRPAPLQDGKGKQTDAGKYPVPFAMAQAQRKAFENAAAQARDMLPRLTPDERRFLHVNLIAHSETMAALSGWLENLMHARTLLADGQEETAATYLHEALRCLERLDAPRAVLCEGEKWKDWYRGEKKMDIHALRAKTEETVALLSRRN